jgi:tricorn protease
VKRLLLVAAIVVGVANPVNAKEPIRLANHPSLSPDGSTIVFDWAGDIWSVPTAGGLAKQLTTNPARDREPKFSPDGKQIVFISDRDAAAQVYVIPAEGGAAKRLTYHTGGYAVQGWTANGQRLLVTATRDHHWRRADRFFFISARERSGEEILFDEYGANGSLSPDGTKLLFTREGPAWWRKGYHGSQASQIWLYDLGAKNYRKILDNDRGSMWPLWKPDGRSFYFVGGQSGSFNLWEFDLASGEQKQLTRFTDDSVVQPCVSKDGSTIVFRHLFDFYRLKNGNGEPQKIDIGFDGDRSEERKLRRTLSTATAAAFTNDGLEIALIAGGDLWVMDTELREPRQITNSPEEEKSPVFAPEGDSILFISDTNGKTDIWRAERGDKSKYWFQNTKFNLTPITNDGAGKTRLTWSPDGSRIAFIKNRGELWVMAPDGSGAKQVIKSFSDVEYDWSPDGKWFVGSYEDADFNRDIWIVSIDGVRPPYNLSRTPDNERNPVWSPDGKLIAYSGRNYTAGGRGGGAPGTPPGEADGGSSGERDIHYVWLRTTDDQVSSRDRSVEKALEKMNKARQPGGRRGAPQAAAKDDSPEQPEPRPAANRRPNVTIDFERLHERVKVLSIPGTTESNLFWSADGKKLLFNARVDNQAGIFSVDFPDDLRPRLFSSTPGMQARWLRSANQVVWLVNGVPGSMPATAGGRGVAAAQAPAAPTPGAGRGGRGPGGGRGGRGGATTPAAPAAGTGDGAGTGTTYAFQALQLVDVPAKNAAVFDLCWRTMRDNWYDWRLNNRDWSKIRIKYLDAARQTPDTEALTTVVQLMLGELNGSHLGFTAGSGRGGRGGPGPRGTPAPDPDEPAAGRWSESTVHLGVRFDPSYRGPGLRVRDVLPNGPADHRKTKIDPGETIVSIDGTALDIGMDLTTVLNTPPGKEFVVKVRAIDGKEREVTIRPITFVAARQLLYEKWLDDNRKAVDKLSKGTLGYIYVRAMDMPSFQTFQRELYNAGAGKDGLVIDVRENGGGSTTDHLLTALTQPVHAITIPRDGTPGYPHDRMVYARWTKPIVVLCNQNSFSNAEIFSHAIKTLKRGQLVGVPTAGGVISTGAAQIMDVGTLRLPTRGWYTVNDGEDMELHGAVPDHIVWPQPGDTQDMQVAKAVEVLLADVKSWKARPQPPLKKASERK